MGWPPLDSEHSVIIGSPMASATQRLVSKIIDSSAVLQEIKQNGADTSRTQIFRAAILFFFDNIHDLKNDASILVGASTTQSMNSRLRQTLKEMKKR